MVFTSTVFLFYFLPLFILAYCAALAAKRFLPVFRGSFGICNLVILLFSLLFYFWGENNATLILLGVILLNYIWAFFLAPSGRAPDEKSRKRRIAFCVAANLLCLFVFKYATFAMTLAARALGLDIAVPDISLPLGISFFTFQAMSYSIDVYRGVVPPNRSFTGFAAYIAMFPQLVAGPIVRYADIAAQLASRAVTTERFASGVRRFIFGLAKKVLIANQVAAFVDTVFGVLPDSLTPGIAWAGIVCYAVQIYFDFSGYSDMAIGMGRMLGFEFRENFLHPYSAVSMQDFWRRWHISLSSWFRDYLYIPLGGNRKGNLRTYVNLCVVFLLCGLWHGAAMNFLLWGAYHGAFLIFERVAKIDFDRHRIAGRIYTVLAILFGWVLFRAEGAEQILAYGKAMLFLNSGAGGHAWLWFTLDVRIALAAGILLSFPVYDAVRSRLAHPLWRVAGVAGLLCLLLFCIPFIVGESYNPFIYFRF